MRPEDRSTFAGCLGAALASPQPVKSLNELLRRVLTSEPVPGASDDQRLIRDVAEQLDMASEDPRELLIFACDTEHLLTHAASNEAVRLLFDLMRDRQRALTVMSKYASGTITRTGLLSFFAEQSWPERLRRRMAALSGDGLANVRKALEESDIAQLEAIIIT